MIFISYSRNDHEFARSLESRLTALGLAAWLDLEQIPFGADFVERVSSAVSQANVFIPVITSNYLASKWCLFELEMALATSRKGELLIVPVAEHAELLPKEIADLNAVIGTPLNETQDRLISSAGLFSGASKTGRVSIVGIVEQRDMPDNGLMARFRREAALVGIDVRVTQGVDLENPEFVGTAQRAEAIVVADASAAACAQFAADLAMHGRTIHVLSTTEDLQNEISSRIKTPVWWPSAGSVRPLRVTWDSNRVLGLERCVRGVRDYIDQRVFVRTSLYDMPDGAEESIKFFQMRLVELERLKVEFDRSRSYSYDRFSSDVIRYLNRRTDLAIASPFELEATESRQ
jgi:hypothetical protein